MSGVDAKNICAVASPGEIFSFPRVDGVVATACIGKIISGNSLDAVVVIGSRDFVIVVRADVIASFSCRAACPAVVADRKDTLTAFDAPRSVVALQYLH